MLRSRRGAGTACLARGGITHSSAVFCSRAAVLGRPRAGGDIGPDGDDGGNGNCGARMGRGCALDGRWFRRTRWEASLDLGGGGQRVVRTIS